MTGSQRPDASVEAELENLFADARRQDTQVDGGFLQRVHADATAHQPAPNVLVKPSARKRKLSWFHGFGATWQTGIALSFFLAIGFGLGLNPPSGLEAIGEVYGIGSGLIDVEDSWAVEDIWSEENHDAG